MAVDTFTFNAWLVAWFDECNKPRAFGVAPTYEQARDEADRQAELYRARSANLLVVRRIVAEPGQAF